MWSSRAVAQLARGVDDGVAAEHGRPGRGRLTGLELALGVDEHADRVRRHAELLARDLAQDGVHALAHLGPGVVEGDRPVGLGPQDHAAVLGDAVPDAGVLQAAGDPRERRVAVGVLDGEEGALEPDAGAEQLAGRRAVAGVEGVAPADLPAVDPDELGERVQHALHREVRLVDAEAAHRAAGRVVRVDGGRLDVDVVDAVGAAGMARCALEHLVADARVRARVADDARPDGEQAAVRVAGGGVVEPHGVALRVEAQALLAGEGEEHRPSGSDGEQRGVALDVQVLLGPEGAARGHLRDAHALVGNGEELRDLPAVVPDCPGPASRRAACRRPRARRAPPRARETRAR